MAYTVKTTTGYGSRLGNSFRGIGTGFVLFIAATCLLWWNEGRAVKTAKMLEEAAGVAVHVDNIATVDPQYEGQLIHANGVAQTDDVLTDGTFGIRTNAIQLTRRVEYFQWVEHSSTKTEDKIGGSQETTTTYTYSKDWSSRPVNSGDFADPEYKNVNFTLLSLDDARQQAQNVRFGAYRLNDSQIAFITGSVAYNVDSIPAQIEAAINQEVARVLALKADSVRPNFVHVRGNQLYVGRDLNVPEVGDVRITFTRVPASQDISLMAVQQGDGFCAFKAKNGKTLCLVSAGTRSMDEMFEQQETANTFILWALRVLGLVLVCAGLKGIFEILVTLLKVLPFLATILNFGVSLVCNVVGFAWTLIIIALAWLFYRPLLAIALLALAGAVVYFFVKRGRKAQTTDAV